MKIKRREIVILVKLHAKCAIIIIYALGSGNENFGISIKAVPKLLQSRNSQPGKAGRTPEPSQIETGILNY